MVAPCFANTRAKGRPKGSPIDTEAVHIPAIFKAREAIDGARRSGLKIPAIIAFALSSTASGYAQSNDPRITVCQGDLYRAGNTTNPRYKNASWIGNCYFKFDSQDADAILHTCQYGRPCTVKATVLGEEIVEIHGVELSGHDMTCRGKLTNTDKYAGNTAKIGPCKFTIDLYPGVSNAILAACRYGRACTVRARVDAGEVVHVYRATRT
jgi:hypothetical protein